MSCYPEDIVNQMSLSELQNCDWDALFRQITLAQTSPNFSFTNGYNHYNGYNSYTSTLYYSMTTTTTPYMTPYSNESFGYKLSCDGFTSSTPMMQAANQRRYTRKKLFINDVVNREVIDDGEPGEFTCKVCNEVCLTRASLITHVKVHQQPFCVLCLSSFKSLSGYRIHNSKLHNISWPKRRRKSSSNDDNNNNLDEENDTSESNHSDGANSHLNDEDDEDEDTESGVDTKNPTRISLRIDNKKHALRQPAEKKNHKVNNMYDIYDNVNTVTLTSKYGRRRKVLDMTTVIKPTKKSKKVK